MLNPSLIAVSALFFVGLTSVFFLASYAIISVVLRLAKGRVSHSVTKRLLIAALVIPAVAALALTVGGVTLHHIHSAAGSEHHSTTCSMLFEPGDESAATLGAKGVAIGAAANVGAWALIAVGVFFAVRLFRATAGLESGLTPFLASPSSALTASLERVSARMPTLDRSRFFECPIPTSCSSVLGFRQARCVLSAEFIADAPGDEIDSVVAHEASHLASGDVPATFLVGFLNCLFFYVRPVRVLARRWREEAELACDDRAVAITMNPLSMAAAILRASGKPVLLPSRLALPAVALAFADDAACPPAVRVERLLRQAQEAAFPLPSEPGGRSWKSFASWSVTILFAGVGFTALLSAQAICYAHCSLEAVARLLP